VNESAQQLGKLIEQLQQVDDELRDFFKYLYGKRTELWHLSENDVVMAKTIMDIHRLSIDSVQAHVPLHALQPLHRLDRDNVLETIEQRAELLQARKAEIMQRGVLDKVLLKEVLQSASGIKIVERLEQPLYIAFEGNGRLEAMRRVFTAADGVLVEVEQYRFDDDDVAAILRRLERVRRLNGLTD
jgi:hypothetical protein